ncbi:zinc-ribbon domain-containing protein, partial [Mesoaciditoga lauensis]
MKCPFCGSDIPDNSKTCPVCGAVLAQNVFSL